MCLTAMVCQRPKGGPQTQKRLSSSQLPTRLLSATMSSLLGQAYLPGPASALALGRIYSEAVRWLLTWVAVHRCGECTGLSWAACLRWLTCQGPRRPPRRGWAWTAAML